MKKILGVLLGVAVLASVPAGYKKYSAYVAANEEAAFEQRAIDKAQQIVRSSLKDPSSAQFEDVRFYANTSGVCGKVNAKNSFGGYVGASPFFVDAAGKAMLMPRVSATGSADEYLELKMFLDAHKKVCGDAVGT